MTPGRPARIGALAAVLLLMACGQAEGGPEAAPTPASSSPAAPSSASRPSASNGPTRAGLRTQTLTGSIERGVESGCLILQGYLLIGGDRELLRPGRVVTVTGRVAPNAMTSCQQGTPFSVLRARPG